MKRFAKRIEGQVKKHARSHSPATISLLLNISSWVAAPRWLYVFSPVERSHLWPERGRAMARLITEHFKSPPNLLEIGTWFGEGSTPVWLNALPSGSHLVLLDAWRPYVSSEDRQDGLRHYSSMDLVPFAAWHSVARHVFRYERDSNRVGISVLRGDSSRSLSLLSADSFDVVFVDGSHYYPDVKHDLTEAVRITKRAFGLICGDDLECEESPELLELARASLMRDTINTPQGPIHPGVLLAVHEVLGRVNTDSGFWWTFVVDGVVTPDYAPTPTI